MTTVNSQKFVSVVSDKLVSELKRIFASLDRNDDMIVEFQDLVAKLEDDSFISNNPEELVFFVKALNLEINLGKVMKFLEEESFTRVGDKYISWREFETYFTVLRDKLLSHVSSSFQTEENLEIDPDYLRLIRDVFDSVERELNDFVFTENFIEAAFSDIQIRAIFDQFARRIIEGEETINENVKQVLFRIEAEAKELISWREILTYFSGESPLG